MRDLGPLDRGPDREPASNPASESERKAAATHEVVKTVEDAIADLDWVRQHLAKQYATLESGTVAEFEIGEVLQAVRKAVVRSRKALGEVAQMELPLRIV